MIKLLSWLHYVCNLHYFFSLQLMLFFHYRTIHFILLKETSGLIHLQALSLQLLTHFYQGSLYSIRGCWNWTANRTCCLCYEFEEHMLSLFVCMFFIIWPSHIWRISNDFSTSIPSNWKTICHCYTVDCVRCGFKQISSLFYYFLCKRGVRPSEALVSAKNSMQEDPEFNH